MRRQRRADLRVPDLPDHEGSRSPHAGGRTLLALLLLTATVQGADWWVRAGATGDGRSRDDPSGTLWMPLTLAERGDVIHIARGEYNGNLGKGGFPVHVPGLTLVGGYDDDFSERHPFVHRTLLRCKQGVVASYTDTVEGILGCRVEADKKEPCYGLTVDGLWFDGSTRNKYTGPGRGRLVPQGSWHEPLLKLSDSIPFGYRDLKIRNCVFVNGYYQGILVRWQGDGNEVSNCLFVNLQIAGIDCAAAEADVVSIPDCGQVGPTTVTMRHNTFAFFWSHDKAQQANGINLGSQGRYAIEDNVFLWMHEPKGFGVQNAHNNQDVTLRGNVFFHMGARPYTFSDEKGQPTFASGTAVQDDNPFGDLDEPTPAAGGHVVAGNLIQDPGLKPDLTFVQSFTGFQCNKRYSSLEALNGYRESLGLAPFAEHGQSIPPEENNWGAPYPLDELMPQLVSTIEGKGVQFDGPFATYASTGPEDLPGASMGDAASYGRDFDWAELKSDTHRAKYDGRRFVFKAGLGPQVSRWDLHGEGIDARNYLAIQLRLPGETGEEPAQKLVAYVLDGSRAAKTYNTHGTRSARARSWPQGTPIAGTLHFTGYSGSPYVVVVDFIGPVR